MKKRISCWVAGISLFSGAFAGDPSYRTIGTVYRDDPRIGRLIPETAVMEVLAGGFDWSEGPVWIREGTNSS